MMDCKLNPMNYPLRFDYSSVHYCMVVFLFFSFYFNYFVVILFQELKRSIKKIKVRESETDDFDQGDSQGFVQLYGKWQLEPLQLPRAINGIVPKVSSLIFYFLLFAIHTNECMYVDWDA